MANDFLFGTQPRFERVNRFAPKRAQAFDTILEQALSGLSQQPDFAPIEQREIQRFNQETVPGIAERFTGSRGSSAFQEALSRGATQLGTNLGALRSQYQLGQQQNLMNLLGMGLTPQQDTAFFQGRPGFLESAAPGLGAGAGQGLSYLLGQYFNKDQGNQPQTGTAGGSSSFLQGLLPVLGSSLIGGLSAGPIGSVAAGAPGLIALLLNSLSRSKNTQPTNGSVNYSLPNV